MNKSILKRVGLLFATLLLMTACGGDRNPMYPNLPPYDPTQDNLYRPNPDTHGYQPPSGPNQGYQPEMPRGASYTVLRNVFLRVEPEIGILVKHLEGRLEPKRAGDPLIFDDPRSFICHVNRSEMIIDSENITRLKNKYTFNFADSPIKEVQVEFLPGRLRMSGKMKQIFWVPFSMEGSLSPTADGKIQLVPDSIKAAGIQVKNIMEFLGLTTSKLISIGPERGLIFQGNVVTLDPARLFPPPQIQGRVVAVDVQQGFMRLFFDNGQQIPQHRPPDLTSQNYMHVYGGQILIMNELHRDAELQMVDMNPADPFDFFLEEYKRHLRAGYVKVANDKGALITLMPDYTQLGQTDVWDGFPGGRPNLRPYAQQGFAPFPMR